MINEIVINTFLEVADSLNFTTAANNLFLTQQAVSKQIKGLEEDLQLRLFSRDNHSISLTPEGKELYKLLYSFKIQYRETLVNLREQVRIRNNHLNLGIQSRHHVGYIPARVINTLNEKFVKFHVTMEMHSAGTLLRKLNDGVLDFITIDELYLPNPQDYNMVKLHTSPVYLAVAEQLPKKEYASLPLILADADLAVARENHKQDFYQHYGLDIQTVLARPNWDAVIINVELGAGIALITGEFDHSGLNIKRIDTGFTSTLLGVWKKNDIFVAPAVYGQELKKCFDKEQKRKA